MPYAIRKMPNQDCFRVYNRRTKKVYAKCSSFINAKRQIRLLTAIEYGNFTPTGRKVSVTGKPATKLIRSPKVTYKVSSAEATRNVSPLTKKRTQKTRKST